MVKSYWSNLINHSNSILYNFVLTLNRTHNIVFIESMCVTVILFEDSQKEKLCVKLWDYTHLHFLPRYGVLIKWEIFDRI